MHRKKGHEYVEKTSCWAKTLDFLQSLEIIRNLKLECWSLHLYNLSTSSIKLWKFPSFVTTMEKYI
jgi:hypothetical protein